MDISKVIDIDDLIELWKNVYEGKWDAIAPNLGQEIRDIWGREIMLRFDEAKSGGSYGGYGDSPNWASLIRTNAGPGGRVQYNEAYAKKFPFDTHDKLFGSFPNDMIAILLIHG